MTATARQIDEVSLVERGSVRYVERPTAPHEIVQDVELIMWSLKLHGIKRYFHQRFWEEESRASDYAAKIEPSPRLESVSDHSWHIGYISNLLAHRYEDLDREKILQLAMLHDVLEIIVGDRSPIGRDGTGQKTHAFNDELSRRKEQMEETALQRYLAMLPKAAADDQAVLLRDYMSARTQEARFVKSIDKLQTLAYVLRKKAGVMEDKHVRFTIAYSEKGVSYFPPLQDHFRELQRRILDSVAKVRKTSVRALQSQIFGSQLKLWSDEV